MLLYDIGPTIEELKDPEVPVNTPHEWYRIIDLVADVFWRWFNSLDAEAKNKEIFTFKKWFISYTVRVGDLGKIMPFVLGSNTFPS